jgi:hypothetical protein
MKAHDLIKESLGTTQYLITNYIGDFNDAELLVRPVPNANHIAWQLGHIISAEYQAMEQIKPGLSPKLPAGFAEAHSKETAGENSPDKFLTKAEYLNLYNRQRNATMQVLEQLTSSDLEKPGPESMRSYAPTVGSVILMQATHGLMHAGQFVCVRRKLSKPILF